MSKIIYNEANELIDAVIAECIENVVGNRFRQFILIKSDDLFIYGDDIDSTYTFQQLVDEIGLSIGIPPSSFVWQQSEEEKIEEKSYYSIDLRGTKDLDGYIEKAFSEYTERINKEQ